MQWGIFEYLRMSFGLLNTRSTFQRAMDFTFRDLIGKIIEIYHLTVFSKDKSSHVCHLRKVFERCKRCGISLNPKKSIFGLDWGKLLGNIVSKDGIQVDPTRVDAIMKVPLLENRKAMQPFFGKINFIKKFMPNIGEIVKPI
jgi:hypothetical protein